MTTSVQLELRFGGLQIKKERGYEIHFWHKDIIKKRLHFLWYSSLSVSKLANLPYEETAWISYRNDLTAQEKCMQWRERIVRICIEHHNHQEH